MVVPIVAREITPVETVGRPEKYQRVFHPEEPATLKKGG
jgi:hypothetical protein